MRYVFYALLIYLGYQLIFNLIIPVYRASRRFKKQFSEMQQRMQEQMKQQHGYQPSPAPEQPAPGKVNPGDYIEFEEVK